MKTVRRVSARLRRPGARKAIAGAARAATSAAAGAAIWAAARRRRRLRSEEIRPLRSLWTTVEGRPMHALASADVPNPHLESIVLVHGFGVASFCFTRLAKRLATRFSVYAIDLPGHGRSKAPPNDLKIPEFADALVAWMGAAGLRRVSLIGASMGCQVVVDAAVRYAERFDRLVLLAPTTDPSGRTFVQHIARFAAGLPLEPLRLRLHRTANWARRADRLLPELRHMLNDPIERKLPQVIHPVLMMRGERDKLVPQRWFDEAARLVGARRCVVIPGEGHSIHYTAARQVADAVISFLRSPGPIGARLSRPSRAAAAMQWMGDE
ncbi:MAG TPA: alpha/beta hydrolase [Pirellulales bacterium]|nr:alpha/beta hydrolase [Pirellulales bacterium]